MSKKSKKRWKCDFTSHAPRDEKIKEALELRELEDVKVQVGKGMADLSAGSMKAFDIAAIIKRGRQLLAGRSQRNERTSARPIEPC